ncbi:hypothetical protein ACWDNI_26660 [Nocardia niigatensis]
MNEFGGSLGQNGVIHGTPENEYGWAESEYKIRMVRIPDDARLFFAPLG